MTHLHLKWAAALILVVLLPVSAWAGIIITEQDYAADDPELKSFTISTIQKNKVRIQAQDDIIVYIWDMDKNQIMQLNTAAKAYTAGSFKDIMEGMKNYMAELQAQMVDEETEEDEEDVGDEEEEDITAPTPAKPAVKEFKIQKTSETAVIAGYASTKVEIRRGGELAEEIWISKDLDLSKDLIYKTFKERFHEYIKTINESMAGEGGDELTPPWFGAADYLKIFGDGFAMKQVEYQDGIAYINEVIKVEKKEIPESEFTAPQGYRKVTVQEFMDIEEE